MSKWGMWDHDFLKPTDNKLNKFTVLRLNWFNLKKKTVFTNAHFYSQAYKSKYYTRIKLLCAVQVYPTGFKKWSIPTRYVPEQRFYV